MVLRDQRSLRGKKGVQSSSTHSSAGSNSYVIRTAALLDYSSAQPPGTTATRPCSVGGRQTPQARSPQKPKRDGRGRRRERSRRRPAGCVDAGPLRGTRGQRQEQEANSEPTRCPVAAAGSGQRGTSAPSQGMWAHGGHQRGKGLCPQEEALGRRGLPGCLHSFPQRRCTGDPPPSLEDTHLECECPSLHSSQPPALLHAPHPHSETEPAS